MPRGPKGDLRSGSQTLADRTLVALLFATSACGSPPTPPATPASSAPPANGLGAAGGASEGAATLGDERFRGPMKPLAPTTMAGELRAIGLDPAALPPMDKLAPETLRRVMKTFATSLGARCDACHTMGDFAAPTPRKAITVRMWDRFTRDLTAADGSALYCDSCHHGTMTPLLDRHDDAALGDWMAQNYVGSVKRRDGRPEDCKTCHGAPFDGHFLRTWASVPTPK